MSSVPNQFPAQKTPITGVSAIFGTGGGAGEAGFKLLLLGVGLAAGTKSAATITKVTKGSDADTYFGEGSTLAEMARAAIEEQLGTQVYCGFVADSGGTQGTVTITAAGTTAATAGTYVIRIDGFPVITVSIASGATPAEAALAVDVAIKASPYYGRMCVTSGNATTITTLTTKEDNVEVQDNLDAIYDDISDMPSGITLTLAAGVSAAGALDLTAILAKAATTTYNHIVACTSDSTNGNLLEAHCTTYSGPTEAKYCEFVFGSVDTVSNIKTLTTGINAFYGQVLGFTNGKEPKPKAAARWTAHRQFEEQKDAGTPYRRYPMRNIRGPVEVDEFYPGADIEDLLDNGCTPVAMNDGGEPYIPRSVTTHCQTSGGAPDDSVLDTANVSAVFKGCRDALTFFDTIYTVSEGVAFRIDDDPSNGGAEPPPFTATPNLFKGDIWSLMDTWFSERLIVNPDTPVDYKATVSTSRDGNRLNGTAPFAVAGGVYIIDLALIQSAG